MLTDEQKKLRMQGTGGSELGAAAGLNPFMSPLHVYLEKTGQAPAFDGNEDTDRGDFFEDGTAKWWAKKTGATDLTEPGTLLSQRHKYLLSTPDRKAKLEGEPLVAQIKVPRLYARGWGESGTDAVPAYVLAQIHSDMHVAETELGHVVRFHGDELHIHPVGFDTEFFGLLVEANNRLWVDHILKRVPPEAGHQDADVLKHLHPKDTEPKLSLSELSGDVVEVVEAFRRVKGQFEEVKERHDGLVNRLKQIIGNRAGLETPFGAISYRNNKSSIAVDWQAVVQEFRNYIQLGSSQRPELRGLLMELEAIEGNHTKEKPGARPFIARLRAA